MATSFVRFAYRGYWAKDGVLELWLSAVAQLIERDPDAPAWLCEMAAEWRAFNTVDFSGAMDARLNQYVTSDKRATILLDYAEDALRKLEARGPQITREVWSDVAGVTIPKNEWGRDFAAEYVTNVGRKFIKLLRGESDPRIEPCDWAY